MKKLSDLIDEYPYLFFWVLPVAILGFFFRPAWYALGMVFGIALLAGIVHAVQAMFKN